jgi:hypothetical protein
MGIWAMKLPWCFAEFEQGENRSGSRTIAESMQISHRVKKYSMVVSRTFAKYREKRNFAKLFIHSAERDLGRNCISLIPKRPFAHLSAMQYEGVAMPASVPVAPVMPMFTSLKWMRMGA